MDFDVSGADDLICSADGKWVLDVAVGIGTPLAIEALKNAIGA